MSSQGSSKMSLLGPEGRAQLKTAATVGGIGLELALSVALGYFGGRWLDQQLDTAPWLKWLGLAFGLASGVRAFFRVAKRARKALEDDTPET